MFAHDSIHELWISKCAQYIFSVFGAERLRGATVVDYAFGRGNWSLAFLRAGASRVVAIDAAESNVLRFSAYCHSNSIQGIDIRLGNVVEQESNETYDVIWAYGILHHIAKKQLFLERIANCLADDRSEALIYSYNSNCLRQRIVSAARTGTVYESADSFESDALLFNPLARLRARDDLTAPWIEWCSRQELTSHLGQAALKITRAVISFSEFIGSPEAPEFSPHHVVCRRSQESLPIPICHSEDDRWNIDDGVIGDLADWIVSQASNERKNFAIGLFNTHFPALRHGGYAMSVAEDFQFLIYCCRKLSLGVPEDQTLAMYLQAGLAATNGTRRSFPEDIIRYSGLARFLRDHTIRL
jgi:hypothetical protein